MTGPLDGDASTPRRDGSTSRRRRKHPATRREHPASGRRGGRAREIAAGTTSDYAAVLALRDWFLDPTSGFTYSLTPGRGPSGDPVVDFLDHRTGYCQQFAATMAVMVRALGIPARVATGFVPGTEQEDGSLLVTAHDAHAWVEVPFAGVGWLAFDPTPPGARGASDAGAEGAQGAEGEGAEAGEPDQGEESPGTDQHGADAAAPGADGQVDDLGPGAPGQPDSLGEGGEPGPVPTRGRWRLVLGTAGAALLLMAFAPRVVRGLVRGHRLSSRSLSRPAPPRGSGTSPRTWRWTTVWRSISRRCARVGWRRLCGAARSTLRAPRASIRGRRSAWRSLGAGSSASGSGTARPAT